MQNGKRVCYTFSHRCESKTKKFTYNNFFYPLCMCKHNIIVNNFFKCNFPYTVYEVSNYVGTYDIKLSIIGSGDIEPFTWMHLLFGKLPV